jgi:hypothetical protein
MVMVPFTLRAATVNPIVRVPTVLPEDTVSAVTFPLTVAAVAPSISMVVAPLTAASVLVVAVTFTGAVAAILSVPAHPDRSTTPCVTVKAVKADPVIVVLFEAWPFTLDTVVEISFRLIVLSAATEL